MTDQPQGDLQNSPDTTRSFTPNMGIYGPKIGYLALKLAFMDIYGYIYGYEL